MLGTVLCLRLYLHLVRVQHVYPGGYLVHHLFLGVLIELPAAFILAYLVATQASDRDYVSWVSLGGSVAFISMAGLMWEILQLVWLLETSFFSGSAGDLESNKWTIGSSLADCNGPKW